MMERIAETSPRLKARTTMEGAGQRSTVNRPCASLRGTQKSNKENIR